MRILITGCSSGFGLGTARLLAEQGHDVIATVRNPATATELRDLQASGLPITIESLDIRDAENARDVMTRVLENGGLDALVNNAGASIFAAVEASSIDQMRDLMALSWRLWSHQTRAGRHEFLAGRGSPPVRHLRHHRLAQRLQDVHH
jgi:NAD(P)-dependent dehydrogenase (short-subunit alcohol dehydrogenase family)